MVSVSHPDYLDRMAGFFLATHMRGLLLRGTEGEVYANPRRRPCMTHFHDGCTEVLAEAEEGSIASIPEMPEAMDAVTTARWIKRALAGEVEVPSPIQAQVRCCLQACQR